MLSKIDLDRSMDKKTYKDAMDELEKKLAALQLEIRDRRIPVVIAFEGWGAAGKGTHIARLTYPLDPRYFNVYTMGRVSEDMAMRPFLWPYWVRTPAKGRLTIFDKSWHRMALPDGVSKRRLTVFESEGFYRDVNAFERQLTDDGALILKFFLHISCDEQRKRFRDLEKNPDTAWRVGPADWAQNHDYDENLSQFEEMLKRTDNEANPWHIIESEDRKYGFVKICRAIIARTEARLALSDARRQPVSGVSSDAQAQSVLALTDGDAQARSVDVPPDGDAQTPSDHHARFVSPGLLAKTDPAKSVDDDIYRQELSAHQKQLSLLGNRLYLKRRPVVITFEGWDAAGKGGCIKRLTEELDPRCFEVVPIAAPTSDELAHHYLWRFYNKLPKDGHFGIFDRSWYGRVLVERVEKLTPEPVWRRAYEEINAMEAHWAHHGAIILKFWLHIDRDEQLERFEARQNDPLKRYKITEEDWRNREKWPLYEEAAEEMLAKTHTHYAPWTVVEANSKKYARLKIIRIVTDALSDALR